MSTESAIIRQMIDLGWEVKVKPTHITASKDDKFGSQPIFDGIDPEQEKYKAVYRLAEMVGIDLEDG